MKMGPFKIIAEMTTGQIATTDRFLPIDSILSYAWIKLNMPDALYNSNPDALTAEKLIKPELPLEKRTMKNEWYWAASFAVYQASGEFITYWHKRFDKEFERFLGGKKLTFSPQSGRFRSYRMPLLGNLAERIVWYCYGDPEEALKLLKDGAVTHIGKKRSSGYGLVKEWIIEECDKDYSEVGPEGELMRAMLELPTGIEKGGITLREYGIRPPYWHRDNIFKCMVPVR